jgi:endonuclease G
LYINNKIFQAAMKKMIILLFFLNSLILAQEFNYLPTVKEGEVVKHTYYTLSFVDKYKQAEWAAYKLTDWMIKGPGERDNKFKPDPLIENGTAVDKDYRNSGYDRGHLCPAADMSWLQEAMDETFYLSNISPQKPLFNRGIWKALEEKVREWVKKEHVLYIVTGGALDESLSMIGVNKNIAVPKLFYKVILDYDGPEKKGIGFILANEASAEPLSDFAVTIDSVEALTHIDFFPAIPDKTEREIEGKLDLAKWNLDAPAPEKVNVNEKADSRCKAYTKEGTRCKRKAVPGSDYCRQHQAYEGK